jgi:hypothetical protein
MRPLVVKTFRCALLRFVQTGINAAALQVAENYVKAFRKLAKESNTMIIPNNPDDVSNAVAKVINALSIFQKVKYFFGFE